MKGMFFSNVCESLCNKYIQVRDSVGNSESMRYSQENKPQKIEWQGERRWFSMGFYMLLQVLIIAIMIPNLFGH